MQAYLRNSALPNDSNHETDQHSLPDTQSRHGRRNPPFERFEWCIRSDVAGHASSYLALPVSDVEMLRLCLQQRFSGINKQRMSLPECRSLEFSLSRPSVVTCEYVIMPMVLFPPG